MCHSQIITSGPVDRLFKVCMDIKPSEPFLPPYFITDASSCSLILQILSNFAIYSTNVLQPEMVWQYFLQVSHRCQLEQGGYLILPTTFEPGQESSFTLRVYSSKPLKLKWVQLMLLTYWIQAPNNIRIECFSFHNISQHHGLPWPVMEIASFFCNSQMTYALQLYLYNT
jgi:hypothetical protein